MTDTNQTIESSKSAKLNIGVLCIGMDPDVIAALETMVARIPGAHVVDNVDRHIVPREVMRLLEGFQYRICIIDFDQGLQECCRLAERLRDSCDKTLNLFAASDCLDSESIIAAMRSGCSEFLAKPFDSQKVSEALAHVESRRHIRDDEGTAGRIVTLMGGKGGTGVTSLALHLALNLVQRHHQKCMLVDLHHALGDASLYLGLARRKFSFYELVHNTERLDAELLQGFLLQHESGLHVLDSSERIDGSSQASPEAIEHTLAFLSDNYQFVIIDCPPGMAEDTSAAIRQSDQLAIVITPELPAIRNALRLVEYLVSMHYPDKNIDIVLNRSAKNNALSEREIETALRRPIAVRVPNSFDEISQSINAGMPIAHGHKSNLPLAFDLWADRLIGHEADKIGSAKEETKGGRGWLRQLGFSS
jgi:pilus assembly protein CpaE